jgi:chromosome segregation ATPase
MEFAFLIGLGTLAIGLAILLGVALGRYVWPTAKSDDAAALATAQTEVARLNEECAMIRNRAEQLEAEIRAEVSEKFRFAEEAARLAERVDGLLRQFQEHSAQRQSIEAQRENAITEAKVTLVEVAQ